jgi:hypothetical protein
MDSTTDAPKTVSAKWTYWQLENPSAGKMKCQKQEKPQGSKDPAALTGDFARTLVNRQQRDQPSADLPC